MKQKSLGEAGRSLLIEEFLPGLEVSVLAAVSAMPGKKGCVKPFLSARDHKRRFEGGEGPNTGGMGAVSPVEDFSPAARLDFEKNILEPTLRGIEAEKMDYRGFIFFGLMVHEDKCSLLEYNVRLGDPETEAVLPLLESDFYELSAAISDCGLEGFALKWKKASGGGTAHCCAPVLVSGGYPGPYEKGLPIAFNEEGIAKTGAKIFVAGAGRGSGGVYGSGLRTGGGRVLAVSALGNSADEARERAYKAIQFINFEGMDYRADIGREVKHGF
jgi:phosphoribosylamine--glycine ligase